MSFSGNVASITLDEVFAFLADNALEGKLIIRSGEAALTLFFKDGQVFFPASGRRGTYSLNAILRHTGVISPEALAGYLQDLQTKLAAPEEEESDELKAARRMQYTEEIHDLFLWGDAAFEFHPCRWPQQAVAEHRLGRGLVLETQGLLLEAARRADERLRIRRWIPSGRLILRAPSPEATARVRAALLELNLELEEDVEPFSDQRNLDDLLAEWRVPHHLILATLAKLVEAGDLEPLPAEDARTRFEELLADDYLGGAARYLAHWVDLDVDTDAEPLELAFARSGAFRFGPLTAVTLRLAGPRTFALLRALLEGTTPFTLILRRRGREKRVVGGPDEVCVSRRGRWTRSATPDLRQFLRKLGHLTPEALAELPDDEAAVAAVPPEAFSEALVAKLIDELAEVAYWARCEVELHNVALRDKQAETELPVGLGVHDREQLEAGLEGWGEVLRKVPGEDCIFVLPRARAEDGAPSFFTRFELSRSAADLRRETQASTLEFARFVARGLDLGWLRQATKKELLSGVEEARAERNDVLAYRLALAGQAYGYGAPFAKLVDGYRQNDVALPGRLPSLQGDLKGVGLAAVLQALHNQQRTGTLTVSDGRRHRNLYFSRGDAFMVRTDDSAADEFVSFFLDSDDPDAIAPRFPQAAEVQAEEEAAELENEFLDALLWDDASFAFTQNALPETFFSDDARRVALATRPFLLRAMDRLREWDRVTTVVGDGRTVLQFRDDDAKLAAVQAGKVTEALTLIDGRLCFDDLVRISQQPRLDVGRTVAGLVDNGQLTILPGIPDAIPD